MWFPPMSTPDSIVCKPTPWFLFRALVMLTMFGAFAVLFCVDGSTGYRKKNEVYYLHKTFQRANEEFAAMNEHGLQTPERWRNYAAQQIVNFPDRSILPVSVEDPMHWPEILQDYDKMKSLQWQNLWLEYSKVRGFDAQAPEEPYDAAKISQQWVYFGVCAFLAALAAFFLFRTLGRTLTADSEGIKTPQGRRIPYADLKTLDLRKWETKGLAFLDYERASGKGRVRIDGLTYGGFKLENGEPAEHFMRLVRANFSGELLEYIPLKVDHPPTQSSPGAS